MLENVLVGLVGLDVALHEILKRAKETDKGVAVERDSVRLFESNNGGGAALTVDKRNLTKVVAG